ncbi:unnamed protein product, partial [Effrenium voratum]
GQWPEPGGEVKEKKKKKEKKSRSSRRHDSERSEVEGEAWASPSPADFGASFADFGDAGAGGGGGGVGGAEGGASQDQAVEALKAMGFQEGRIRQVLESVGGSVEKAVPVLCAD